MIARDASVSNKNMSNVFFRRLCYFLLLIIEFILNIIFGVTKTVCSGFIILLKLINGRMTEFKQKKRKNSISNLNLKSKTIIDANWQKFISSGLLNDKSTEKPIQEPVKQHYTGTFRRSRKKMKNQIDQKNTTEIVKNVSIKQKNDVKTSTEQNNKLNTINNNNKEVKLTKFIAIDCEMVGIGYEGNDHMLARVSLVNKFGDCIYDKFVKPREDVIDYRTNISGVRKEDLLNGEDFVKVQKEVAEIIRGRILVGHSLKHDLSVLFLSHPKRNIRDTSRYKPFRNITKGSTPSLKRLAKEILGIEIQHAEHSSVEDARAAMQLYCTVAKKWEASLSDKRGYSRRILDESL